MKLVYRDVQLKIFYDTDRCTFFNGVREEVIEKIWSHLERIIWDNCVTVHCKDDEAILQ